MIKIETKHARQTVFLILTDNSTFFELVLYMQELDHGEYKYVREDSGDEILRFGLKVTNDLSDNVIEFVEATADIDIIKEFSCHFKVPSKWYNMFRWAADHYDKN